jgi:enoyl-CoA hydratase
MSIDYTRDGHVVTITINRPETRNALDVDHFQALARAWARLRDDDARVAVVTGICVGGGTVLLGSTDIRVASSDARFAIMEPKRGLSAGGGTTVRFPRQMPWAHAMELLLTADMVGADRAMGMGLPNAVVARDQLLPAAYDFAHRIAANAPLAIAATKQAALEGLELDLHEAYANETRLSDMVFSLEDAKEGPLAFAQKRPPVWRGR